MSYASHYLSHGTAPCGLRVVFPHPVKELKQVIQKTYEEHTDITRSLEVAREEKEWVSGRYLSWEHGFLFKRVFKTKFAELKAESETASAKVDELEEQLRLTTIATHVEIEREQGEPYFRMKDDFAGLAHCAARSGT